MNVLPSSNQKYAEDVEDWYKWIGKKVCVSGTKAGILRFFGQTEFADGMWCGVELNEPVGKNNGSVKGVQYFTCKDNHGIFVSLNKVEKVHEKMWDRNSDEQKKLKNRRFTLHSAPSQGKIGRILSDEETTVAQSDKRRKTTFFKFHNDNPSRMSVTSDLQKPQLNNSYVISTKGDVTEDPDDILNKTVILNEENVASRDDLHNITANKTYTESNSVLNATFDINHLQAAELANNNNKETVLDGTFILSDQNVESNEKQICNNASDRANCNAAETDESLCILSLSQMKDFTICTEQFINDSNIQTIHFPNSCGDRKTKLITENKPVLSSDLFQADLNLLQENAVLDDSVFLNNEIENGNNVPYRRAKKSSQESVPCHFSDELKDICFEPAYAQSSTPSEESKQMFAKMLGVKSFNFDDSLNFETKHYSSSTPNKPPAPLELLVEPSELITKVDMPLLPVEESLGNINLSLIDDQTLPNIPLDTARSTEEEPLKSGNSKFDDFHISGLVSHSFKANDVLSTICSEISSGEKLSSESSATFGLPKMSGIISHITDLLPVSSEQPVNINLNVTQELRSDFKRSRSSVCEGNTAISDSGVPLQKIQDTKAAQEGGSVQHDKIFSVSKMYSVATKPINTTGEISSTIKKDSDHDETCDSVSGFSRNSSYCVQKTSSDSSNLDPRHTVPEFEKKSDDNILNQTFNCNSSYTIPLNNSYVCGVNKNENNTANGKVTAVDQASSEPECSVVIEQLHNVLQNESVPFAKSSKNGDSVPGTVQNLNTTVCISSNINSHNLTFDVTENLETEDVGTNKSNFCLNLTKQSVEPSMSRTSDRNRILPNTVTSRSALVTNSRKPCVPNNKEQTAFNKPADSAKQSTYVQSQKPVNRRYSAAARVIPQENKVQPKNQVVSKIDTNLKASRLSLPRQSLGPPANPKKQSDSDNSVFKVPDLKAVKNALNYQRLRQDARKENGLEGSQKYPPGKKNVSTPSSENKSLILKENNQAVNVPVQNSGNSLPAPSSRRSSIQSVSSQSSSKIATFNKSNTSKSAETKDITSKNDQKLDKSIRSQAVGIPPNSQKLNTTRNQKLNDSANNQKSFASNAKEKQNFMPPKKEGLRVPGRFSECAGFKRGIPRRTTLPKLKPVQQC